MLQELTATPLIRAAQRACVAPALLYMAGASYCRPRSHQGVKDETWKREIKLLKSCCDKALESIHVVREALEKAKADGQL
jgi:hypothetical protein